MLTPSANSANRAADLIDREKNPHRWGSPVKTSLKMVIQQSAPSANEGVRADLELKNKQIESLQDELNQERDVALGLEERVKSAEAEPSRKSLLSLRKKQLVAYAMFRFEQEISDSLSIKDMVEEILSFEIAAAKGT